MKLRCRLLSYETTEWTMDDGTQTCLILLAFSIVYLHDWIHDWILD